MVQRKAVCAEQVQPRGIGPQPEALAPTAHQLAGLVYGEFGQARHRAAEEGVATQMLGERDGGVEIRRAVEDDVEMLLLTMH